MGHLDGDSNEDVPVLEFEQQELKDAFCQCRILNSGGTPAVSCTYREYQKNLHSSHLKAPSMSCSSLLLRTLSCHLTRRTHPALFISKYPNYHKTKASLRCCSLQIFCSSSLSRICFNILVGFLFILSTIHPAKANYPPRFILEDNASEIVVNKKEGPATTVGSTIAVLKGFDPDGDALSFGVLGTEGNRLLEVVPKGSTKADLRLRKPLDREVRGEYQLILTLTDGQLGHGEFITQSLLLLVEDVNDNEPVFQPYESTVTIEENAGPQVVARLVAHDRDEGLYGQVLYRLQYEDPEDESAFDVETVGNEAVVRLIANLDYETKSLYQVKVLAVDRGGPGDRVNTGTAAIVVQVKDVEDRPPEFITAPPVTRIPEDISVNSGVLVVRAIDGDKGVNNPISYRILEGDGGFFDLERESGVLYVAKPLDRERFDGTGEAFFIKILAEEQSSVVDPPPFTETEVTVVLEDVNDQTPTFYASHYIAEVPEGAQFNMPVNLIGDAIPEVYDNDQGQNGTFRLELVGDGGLFDVTPREGINLASFIIRVKNSALIDYEKIQMVNFTIVAKETVADRPKSSSALVTIRILDVNDNMPEFEQEYYQVSVREDATEGSALFQIRATDVDSGLFGTAGIRYTDLRGTMANKFRLDTETGLIALQEADALDRETLPEFFLTVEARDDEGRGNRNTVGVHVIVEDVNDNRPIFVQNRYEARVLENSKVFPETLKILARDADLNGTSNHEVRYAIASGDPEGNFTIDFISGEIRPSGVLDFETLQMKGEVRFFNLTSRLMTSESQD